jgi:hypothetical protein
MESQDNTMQRFSAFWAVMGLMGLAAIAGVVVRATSAPKDVLDAEAESRRTALLIQNRADQEKEAKALGLHWQDPQGGHLPLVTIPDELIKKTLPALAARKPVPTTTKTPEGALKATAGKHDPTESEFLKK